MGSFTNSYHIFLIKQTFSRNSTYKLRNTVDINSKFGLKCQTDFFKVKKIQLKFNCETSDNEIRIHISINF